MNTENIDFTRGEKFFFFLNFIELTVSKLKNKLKETECVLSYGMSKFCICCAATVTKTIRDHNFMNFIIISLCMEIIYNTHTWA